MIRVFYHSADFDGLCSGAILKQEHPEAIMYPIDYGQVFPWEEIKEDDTVYMVDFSLQPIDDMIKLNSMCNFIWIDHHDRTIKTAEEAGLVTKGLLDTKFSGCENTWKFLYRGVISIPMAVYLLGRYDVWDHSDSRVLPFQFGMRTQDPSWLKPGSEHWNMLLTNDIRSKGIIAVLLNNGESAREYHKATMATMMNSTSFVFEWKNYRVLAVNNFRMSSNDYLSVFDPLKHDMMMSFSYRAEGYWTFSIRSPDDGDLDVSLLAKEMGGGGHFHAAGFHVKKLEEVFGPDFFGG